MTSIPFSGFHRASQHRASADIGGKKKVIKEVADTLTDILNADFTIPPDILKAIQADKDAWKNFKNFSDVYIRIRIAFIDAARKRPDEFKKRLRYFIEMTAKNKQIGFGGN